MFSLNNHRYSVKLMTSLTAVVLLYLFTIRIRREIFLV